MAAHSFIQCTVRWDIAACVWSAVLSREEIVLMPAVFCYTFSSSESVSTQYLLSIYSVSTEYIYSVSTPYLVFV